MTAGGDTSGAAPEVRRAAQAGFALVETIASALLLVVVGLAIFTSLDVASHTASANKARTVASALAEQDQERMRGFTIDQLSNYHGQQTITVGGADYNVTSRADWVRDSANTTESCSASSTQADYVRITSTVTSGVVGSATKPVTMQGLVHAPVGSFGSNQGTLTIKVVDRDGNPVQNIGVTGSGPRVLSDVTNELGCAVFGYIPVGSYTAQLNTPQWVDMGGQQISSQSATVASGAVTTKTMAYDRAASIHATFVDSAGNTAATAGATKLHMTNPAVATGFPDTSIAAGDTSVAETSLFPFNSAYVIYAGSCANANPAQYGAPAVSKLLDPAEDWTPQIQLPTLHVTVTTSSGTAVPNATVKAMGTPAGCTGDTATVANATNASGMADIPMPYGTYDVCARSLTGQTGKVTAVANTTPGGKSIAFNVAGGGPPC